MRDEANGATDGDLPWKLPGVHSAVIDMGTRDHQMDEALGLNCARHADILLTLTGPLPGVSAAAPEPSTADSTSV